MHRRSQWAHAAVLDGNATLPSVTVDPVDVLRREWPIPGWHAWALCAGMSFAEFFGAASDERPTMKRSEVSRARSICAGCPVKRECLDWALEHEGFGVWGGTSGRQRTIMRAAMKAGQQDVAREWFARWLGT